MSDTLTNPHDKYFREMFSRKEVALDFVQHYLPPEVVQHLDVSHFEISKDSFVDSALAEHFSDMLYQVGLHQHETAYVYLLFDHKSYADSLVAFQLLKYQKARQLAIKTIGQTLVICFQAKLGQYDEQLNQLDLPALETLSDLVFTAKTLAEFEAELTTLAAPPPDEESPSAEL